MKKARALIGALVLSCLFTIPAYAKGWEDWKQDPSKKYYKQGSSEHMWVYTNDEGFRMREVWVQGADRENWYYVSEFYTIAQNMYIPFNRKDYYFDKNGVAYEVKGKNSNGSEITEKVKTPPEGEYFVYTDGRMYYDTNKTEKEDDSSKDRKQKTYTPKGVINTANIEINNKYGWKQDNTGWWWKEENGTYPISTWKQIGGKYYYFGSDGYMLHDTITPDGYKVNSDGVWDQSAAQQTNNNKNGGDAYSNLIYPVDVIGGGFTKNSVDGISPSIGFRNNSGKTIKYIDFEMTPYNSVDDPVKCSIRGYSNKICEATGPYSPDTGVCDMLYSITSGPLLVIDNKTDHPYYYTSRSYKKTELEKLAYAKTFSNMPMWDCVWYNGNVSYIKVSKVTIEYMDGTTDIMQTNVLLYNDPRL